MDQSVAEKQHAIATAEAAAAGAEISRLRRQPSLARVSEMKLKALEKKQATSLDQVNRP